MVGMFIVLTGIFGIEEVAIFSFLVVVAVIVVVVFIVVNDDPRILDPIMLEVCIAAVATMDFSSVAVVKGIRVI